MEIFGFVAGIGGLIELANTVVEYIGDVKDAKDDRRRLRDEIVHTTTLLIRLRDEAKSGHCGDNISSAFDTPEKPLDEFKAVLDRLAIKLKPSNSTLRNVAVSLNYHFTKDKVKEMMAAMERLKSLVQL
jgi:hypothetical protein